MYAFTKRVIFFFKLSAITFRPERGASTSIIVYLFWIVRIVSKRTLNSLMLNFIFSYQVILDHFVASISFDKNQSNKFMSGSGELSNCSLFIISVKVVQYLEWRRAPLFIFIVIINHCWNMLETWSERFYFSKLKRINATGVNGLVPLLKNAAN